MVMIRKNEDATETLVIDQINPKSVQVNTEADLQIIGKGFSEGSLVLVQGLGLATAFLNTNELRAKLTKRETSSLGKKDVKVHDDDDISNTATLAVFEESKVLDGISIQIILDEEKKYLSSLHLVSTEDKTG